MTLLEETVKAKTSVPLWQEVMVLEQFNLREDAPPVDLAARLLPVVQSGRTVSRNNNNDDDLTRRAVKAVLRVALRGKDEAAAGRIVRACADMFDAQFLSIGFIKGMFCINKSRQATFFLCFRYHVNS